MLTEKQAWARAAKLEENFGLCYEIDWMTHRKAISPDMRLRMLDRLETYARRRDLNQEALFWPLDEAGDRARVQFCKRQIKALERRKNER